MSDVSEQHGRLCKDCRWVTWPWRHIRDSGGAMCTHPSVPPPSAEPDFVTGRKRSPLPGTFCDQERRGSGRCGPEGKNWEPRDASPVGFT
jgi:hypothetical protein